MKRQTRLKLVPPVEQTLVDAARGTITKALASLDACVDRVSMMLAEEDDYDDKVASHLAWITKHVAQILGEVRKLEVHDKGMVARMSPKERDELVLEYLRELAPERREEIRRFIDALGAEQLLG